LPVADPAREPPVFRIDALFVSAWMKKPGAKPGFAVTVS
jgi:hypothetical protein